LANSVSGSPSWTRDKLVSSVMSIAGVKLRTKTASEREILNHLSECSNSFSSPLSNRVNLISYAKKIFEKAITFEAWDEDNLVGLIAAYFNDSKRPIGYITHVSVLPEFEGTGIGSQLLLNCINYAVQQDYCEIRLEVNKLDIKAINLYKKHKFAQGDERDNNIIMRWKPPRII